MNQGPRTWDQPLHSLPRPRSNVQQNIDTPKSISFRSDHNILDVQSIHARDKISQLTSRQFYLGGLEAFGTHTGPVYVCTLDTSNTVVNDCSIRVQPQRCSPGRYLQVYEDYNSIVSRNFQTIKRPNSPSSTPTSTPITHASKQQQAATSNNKSKLLDCLIR